MAIQISQLNNINLSDASIKTPQDLGNAASVSQGKTEANAALKIIRSLNPGDIFTGDIMDSSSKGLTIALPDGKSFTAALLNNTSYNIGDRVRFVVQDNNGENVLLKALSMPESVKENSFISNALSAAGLPATERNAELVDSLLKNSMSVSKDTLLDMAKLSNTHSSYPVSDIVSLSKLGIEVNDASLKAFENYSNYNNEINSAVNELSKSVTDSVTNLDRFDKILDILSEEAEMTSISQSDSGSDNINSSDNINGSNSQSALTKSGVPDNQLSDLKNELLNLIKDASAENTSAEKTSNISNLNNSKGNNLSDALAKRLENANDPISLLNELSKGLKENGLDGNLTNKLLQNPAIKKLLSDTLAASFKMDPKDITKEGAVKENIAKTINKLDRLIEYSNENGASSVSDNASNLKNNLGFLNNMNQFVAAAQVPLKNLGDGGEGELYVYRRKNSGADDGTLKAFLHLDMEHLGPVDVYVTLKEKNVSTNFCVGDVETLDFIESHIDELTKALNGLGYNVSTNVTNSEVGGFDFKDEIIAPELPISQIKRYSFDMKA